MKIIKPIPKSCYLACSGGIDSMFALHFLRAGGRDVKPLYFNHGTKFGQQCEDFLNATLDTPFVCGKIKKTPEPGRSLEDFWRECRKQQCFERGDDHARLVTRQQIKGFDPETHDVKIRRPSVIRRHI